MKGNAALEGMQENNRITEKHYHDLMAYLSAGILITTWQSEEEEICILETDEYFTHVTGYTSHDITSLFQGKYCNLIHEKDRESSIKKLYEQLKCSDNFEITYRMTARDGSLLWIREAGCLTGSDKSIKQSVISNVTKLYQYTDQIVQNEQMFRIASKVSGGAVYDYEFSTGTYLMFENAELIYGVPAERIIEETQWFSTLPADKAVEAMADYFYHPSDVPIVLQAFTKLKSEASVHYVARSKRPDGTYLWTQLHIALIFNQDGEPIRRVGYILDIDQLKRHSDQIAQSEQLFRITNNASGGAVFDYDFQSKSYLHFENAENIYGVPATRIISDTKWFGTLTPEKSLEAMIAYFYHPDDADIVRHAFRRLSRERSVTYMARSKRHDGKFVWSKINIALIFDKYGAPVRRVGHILDIDEMAKHMEHLKSQAQSDPLTGIYNKAAAQTIVDTVLRKKDNELCALMVLDIDDFKGVNDTFGHQTGDAVLVDVCSKMKEVLGEQTLGRIGGDEFMVFAMGMENEAMICERAGEICQLFRQTFIGPELNYKISCSIGIAVSNNENSFADLFQKADKALYQAKSEGKDRFCLYHDKE